MTTNRLQQIYSLYHFTDRRNLESINQMGGLYPLADLCRMKVQIPAPGGNQLSHDLDGWAKLDNYVHLCFRSNHPMEYAARQDGRIVESVFLQVHPIVLDWSDVRFAPDIANKAGVSLYSMEEALEQNLIDFEVLYTRTDWRDPEIQQRLQRAERFEVLVPHQIPLKLLRIQRNG